MKQPITRIKAKNFRSLRDVDIELSPLTVLVGPNGSGKSNVLNVLRFLATTVRFDLTAALREWRGFDHIQRQATGTGPVILHVEGQVTRNASSNAVDEYEMKLTRRGDAIQRNEDFTFKRIGGRGRRYTVRGSVVTIKDEVEEGKFIESGSRKLADSQTTGLATLPKLSADEGGEGIRQFTEFLTGIRVLEPDISAARQPSREYGSALAADASNLADALARIKLADSDAWGSLCRDLSRCLPGLEDVRIVPVGGTARSVSIQLEERGLTQPIELADASFGTVRLLALLAALHEPHPAPFIAMEEIDHGLHPYALDLLVDRMRAASSRTQILAATHSPTLLNRLNPEEIVVCDRDSDSGESIIPAISAASIRSAMNSSDWRAGELWFSGAIHGVPA